LNRAGAIGREVLAFKTGAGGFPCGLFAATFATTALPLFVPPTSQSSATFPFYSSTLPRSPSYNGSCPSNTAKERQGYRTIAVIVNV
jgi:hypothetical protein